VIARARQARNLRGIVDPEVWVVGAYCRVTDRVALKQLQERGRGGRNIDVANEFIEETVLPMSIVVTDKHQMYNQLNQLGCVCVCV
jgi:hypothetical protein